MAISHAFSNTQANATGTLTVWNGGSTVSVAATDVVRPQDWNSAHNQFYTLSGNTNNASTASGTNVVLQGAGGVTLAGSTGTIVVSGAYNPAQFTNSTANVTMPIVWAGNSNGSGNVTMGLTGSTVTMSAPSGGGGGASSNSVFPFGPVPLATSAFTSGTSGATGGSTQFTVSAYVSPLFVESPTIFDEVEMLISGQATVAGTGSASNGWLVGIYSNNNSTLSLMSSFQFCHVMSQSSVTAQTHSWFWGTNSAANSSSLAGNVSASFSSLANVNLFDGGGTDIRTIPEGRMHQVVIHTARTSSSNLGGFSSAMCQSWSNTTGASYFGQTIYRPPLGEEMWHGQFSTTLNASNSHNFSLPSAISSSVITNTGGSSQVRIPFVRYYK